MFKGWGETNFGTPIIYEKSEPNKVELLMPIVTQVNGVSNGRSKVKDATGNRKNYEKLCKEVVEFCVDWKSRYEIASVLGYNPDYFRNKIIPRLISDGYLEKCDNKSNRSPKQKYRTP